MVTREQIAEALERVFDNSGDEGGPKTFADALRHWTEFGCCGHLVAKAITRAVETLSGRHDLAWYYDSWVSDDPSDEPYLIAFILVDARTRECLTLNAVSYTPHAVFSVETMGDAVVAVGHLLSLLGVAVEEQISQGGGVR
jgi:hypothetical protein